MFFIIFRCSCLNFHSCLTTNKNIFHINFKNLRTINTFEALDQCGFFSNTL
jgi:hypothetical protein